jgi:pimeloyl-ACP methyl ester carboxylesterase
MKLSSIQVLGRPAVYGTLGTGPPLVFLHGWSLGCRSYQRCLTGLAEQGRHVLSPALPGFGGTANLPPESFTLSSYAEWVGAFLQHVYPDQPVTLVGHSFGGGVAIRTAYDFPAAVDRLIVVNSIGGANWTSHGTVLRTIGERPLWDWGLHLATDLWPPRQLTRVLPVVAQDLASNLLRNPAGIWRVGRLAAGADLSAELIELKARKLPMVIVWGAGDRFLPRLALQSLQQVTDADCLTVSGNHAWLLTQPEAFCEVITNLVPLVPATVRQRSPAADFVASRDGDDGYQDET